MPLEWLQDIKRRSVERDYRFYDPPLEVWRKINLDQWNYKRDTENHLRDLAFMCVLYVSCSRVSEVTRASLESGSKPSITKNQFVIVNDYLMLRNVPILKRQVETIYDYPFRTEIPFPLKGGLTLFVQPIQEYLNTLQDEQELFPFKNKRGHQIVKHCSGEFPHYLRDMGLKMWLRIFSRDLVQLKSFSGHAYIRNLEKYLQTSWLEATQKILTLNLKEI